jgi:hypothetical protein
MKGPKDSIRGKARALDTEIKELQQLFSRALIGIEGRLSQLNGSINHLTRVVNALTELVGADTVQEAVDRQIREDAEQREAAEKQALAEAIDDGYVTVADEVTETSLLVGHETGVDGNAVGTGRQQMSFGAVDPRLQAALLGRKVGDRVKTRTGGDFEIKEIYAVDQEKGRAVLAEKAQKAAETAAEADEQEDASTAEAVGE